MYMAIFLKLFIILSTLVCFYEGKRFYDDRENRGKTTTKIYDISHKYLPDLSKVQYMDILANSIILLPLLLNNGDRQDYVGYLLVILAIRAVFISSTILPKDKSCCDTVGVSTFVFGHCYDKMFSGHFAAVFLFSLIYSKHTSNIWGLVLLNILNTLVILMRRAHYTIDILASFFITLFVFQNKLKAF